MPSLGSYQTQMTSILTSSQGLFGVQPLMESALGPMAYGTLGDNFMDIACHVKPIKVLLHDLNCFVDAKMTS